MQNTENNGAGSSGGRGNWRTWRGDDKENAFFAFDADERTLFGITCGYGDDIANEGEDISKVFVIESSSPPETP